MMRWVLLLVLIGFVPRCIAAEEESPPRNVVLVTIDGFRWQELFGGAQEKYIDARAGGVRDVEGLRARFWRDTPEARRQALLPFFWGTVAKQGQVFGDATRNSRATLTNGLKFSYPGYNELLSGFPDPRINTNDKVPNPNVTVLEWLNRRPGFEGRVSAYGTWDVLTSIVNAGRSKIRVVDGWHPIADEPLTPGERAVNELIPELTHIWHNNALDVITMRGALEHLKKRKPRVMYVMLGETDEWAHARRYDCYLEAAYNADRFLRRLWETVQSVPEHKDRTTLIVTSDHGRGGTLGDWTNHGKEVEGAEHLWMAVIGPDTKPLGVRENVSVTLGQIAATVAEAVGEDFRAASPQSAPALPR